ncbi:PREDICTED: regakine-1-like [Hipposideros armiger]|uniref:Regakine-1-like n=1 Tax=Hipposideros armiger TaxID=186990 RepID=A0A8B7QWM3_HIPAR|nr:PREDICTED: regakine-1-like [Hipposideros armiger]
MRVSLLPLAVLLTVAALHSEANEGPDNNMARCCFSYISRMVPFRVVKGYHRTGTQCPKPAVIFLTKRGQEICANPSKAWVQRYIKLLDRSPKTTVSSGAITA